jgi:plastocyanin
MRFLIVFAAALTAIGIGAAVHAAGVTVDQSGQQFSEKSLAVKPGDIVTFANRDDVTHNINVIDDDDDAVDLGLQKPGASLAYKFDKAGRFKIRCSIHPGMRMTVTVK